MRWLLLPFLSAGAVAAADAPKSSPSPVLPPAELSLAPQPLYGPLRPIAPAHRLALLEARRPLAADDREVVRFADLLARTTAQYLEDAPRIEELTTRLCQEIRAVRKPAAPSEILTAALVWKRPAGSRPDVPRRFSEFVSRYHTLRVQEGKDPKAALSALLPPQAPKPGTP